MTPWRCAQRFTEGADVVIVGAGWIGCEVAAAARKHGANVTMLDPLSAPLVRVLGDQVGESVRRRCIGRTASTCGWASG